MKNQFLRQKTIAQKLASQGFTLSEVLVAAAISLGVLTLGGVGLISIMRSSQVANAQNQKRVELNRSLDFIATEIRHADRIIRDLDTELASLPAGFETSQPDGVEPVLALDMSELPSNQTVIYYTAPSPNELWSGPQVIFRWGPKYNADGTYADPSNPDNWSHEPLVDSIQESDASPSCSNPDWTAHGDLGFGACVDTTGKMAQLFHEGVYDTPIQGSDSFIASTTVATRSSQFFDIDDDSSNGTTLTILEPATLDIQVLGTEITCNEDGPTIGTEASYRLTFGQQQISQASLSTVVPFGFETNISVEPGTELATDGASTTGGGCSPNISASSDNNSDRVLTLQNGDLLPDHTPFGNQLPIAMITQGFIDANQRVTIADNQVIFLYELGSGSPGDASFDYQDLVILATITPDV